jgi:hypothetical protein
MTTTDEEITDAVDSIVEKFDKIQFVTKSDAYAKLDQLVNEYDVPIEEAKISVINAYKDQIDGHKRNKSTTHKTSNMKSHPKYTEYENKSVSASNTGELNVGSDIGDGAEGMVYRVKGEPDLALKIFKKRRIKDGELEKKLNVMIQNQPAGADPNSNKELFFAWPRDTIYYKNKFIGYLMPRVDTENRANIRKYLNNQLSESSSIDQRLKIAINFASAVNIVHKFGFAIGDFNYENIFISKSEDRATLIDCDSFSVMDSRGNEYHGETMYEEAIPPEGRATSSIEAAQMADSFNLAVWLFRILNPTEDGYANPFQAKGNLAKGGKLLEMMAENPFPFWDPKSGLIEPVTGQSTYYKLPIEIRVLFESAFLGGKYHPYKRPSPGVWRDVLYNWFKSNSELNQGSLWRPDTENLAASMTPPGPDADFSRISDSEFDAIETNDGDDIIVGVIRSVSNLTEFTRDVDKENSEREETGFVSNVIVENPKNRRRLTFWDKQAVSAARSLQPGLVIKASGRFTSEDYTDEFNKELYVTDYSVAHNYDGYPPIEELSVGDDSVHVRGKILTRDRVSSTPNSKVMNLVVADATGHISVALWGEMAERFTLIPSGLTMEIIDGRMKESNGKKQVYVYEDNTPPTVTDVNVPFSLNCSDIASIEEGETVDVSGEIVEIYDHRNDSGSKMQGLQIKDESGKIIINIKHEPYVTHDYSKGDNILATNVESYRSSSGYITLKSQIDTLMSVI